MGNPDSIPEVSYQRVPQFDSLLCWAATTEIVVNSFPNVPQVDQYKLASDAYEIENGLGSTAYCNCSRAGWNDCCNRTDVPEFDRYGLQAELVAYVAPKWKVLQKQLHQGRHPIIFGWEYGEEGREGLHFMVVVRYWTTAGGKKRVGIWDPLPVGRGNAYSINYDAYALETATELNNDMGLPVAHWGDYINVAVKQNVVASEPTGGAPSPNPGGRFSSVTSGVEVSQAIRETRQLAAQALADAELPNLSGAGGPAIATPGFPFPVVALSLSDLHTAGSNAVGRLLDERLKMQINVVLYPVESPGETIDNFLMIRSGTTWLQGGYANLAVTRSLVELRERAMPNSDNERSKYYLLSIPALGGFFLGHGTGTDARLMSTADFNSAILEGVWHPAKKVLNILMVKAKGYKLPPDPRRRHR